MAPNTAVRDLILSRSSRASVPSLRTVDAFSFELADSNRFILHPQLARTVSTSSRYRGETSTYCMRLRPTCDGGSFYRRKRCWQLGFDGDFDPTEIRSGNAVVHCEAVSFDELLCNITGIAGPCAPCGVRCGKGREVGAAISTSGHQKHSAGQAKTGYEPVSYTHLTLPTTPYV